MDAALITTLPTGNFTAVLRDTGGSTGIGLVEIYDLDPAGNSRLLNLATRAYVGAGDDVLIGGLIVQSVPVNLLLRGLGPTLASHSVTGVLGDPALELHDFNGAILASNDDWTDAVNAPKYLRQDWLRSTTVSPPFWQRLVPGTYTAVLRGLDGPGVGLLEAYLIN